MSMGIATHFVAAPFMVKHIFLRPVKTLHLDHGMDSGHKAFWKTLT